MQRVVDSLCKNFPTFRAVQLHLDLIDEVTACVEQLIQCGVVESRGVRSNGALGACRHVLYFVEKERLPVEQSILACRERPPAYVVLELISSFCVWSKADLILKNAHCYLKVVSLTSTIL